ncbi:MAG: hypothetical protein PHW62_03325, partial [Candidatus Ratteibacteria bacterium]|nr:hypothetical protein [Candidatus Ratteibacteria bacterium]
GIGVEGESLLTGGVIITVEDGAPPGDPVPISFEELLEFLQELGLLDGGNGGNGAGGNFGGNMLFNNLGNFNPANGQNIINQPLEGPPEEDDELPEPPKPPTEDNETPGNGITR